MDIDRPVLPVKEHLIKMDIDRHVLPVKEHLIIMDIDRPVLPVRQYVWSSWPRIYSRGYTIYT